MAFDSKGGVFTIYSGGSNDSVLVWSKESITGLKKRNGKLQTLQLEAIAYLWEIFRDLLLAKGENISISPGYELLGLRVNRKKRKLDDD